MVYRGCVLENNNNHTIVMTKDSQYIKLVKRGNIDIGKEILFLEEDIIREEVRAYKPLRTIAAAIIFLIMSTALLFQFGIEPLSGFQAYAIVSLDINPSIQFEINKNQIVKDIIPLNEDGKDIITPEMKGMRIEDAVSLSIENAVEKQYLNEQNNVILIADAFKKGNAAYELSVKNNITEKIEEVNNIDNVEYIYITANKDSIKKAKDNKISIGKYKMYEAISIEKPEISIEDVKDRTITEMVKENKGTKANLKKLENKDKDKKDKDEKDKDNKKDNKSNNNDKDENNLDKEDEIDKAHEETTKGNGNKDQNNNGQNKNEENEKEVEKNNSNQNNDKDDKPKDKEDSDSKKNKNSSKNMNNDLEDFREDKNINNGNKNKDKDGKEEN